MDAAGLGRFICLQGADLCYSSFARNQTGLCGFGYIARTGDLARLARLAWCRRRAALALRATCSSIFSRNRGRGAIG